MLVGLVFAAVQFGRSSSGNGTAVAGGGGGGAGVAALEAQVQQLKQELATLKEAGSKAVSGGEAGSCPDRHTPWAPSAERDKTYPELAEFLKKVGAALPPPAPYCPCNNLADACCSAQCSGDVLSAYARGMAPPPPGAAAAAAAAAATQPLCHSVSYSLCRTPARRWPSTTR
jgi:hypothetical protein